MRKNLVVIGVALSASLALTVPAGASPGMEVTKATGEKITGQYIVTLADDASIDATAASVAAERLHTYRAALRGFAAKLNSAQLDRLRRNPNVVRIEEDGLAHVEATQYNPPWGLDRIDQTNLPLSTSYTYNTTAPGVSAYIIDTGIYATHTQFGGRAVNVYDALGGNGTDCNGHGTHLAGTVGSVSYGVAKSVRLRGVRVLNCSGSGSWSGVIAGIDWVTANHVKPAVANLSIGGGYNASVNSATARMISAGVFTAVAAGGSNTDACNYSPASVPGAITTMASDRADNRATFGNWGPCTDLYAPGVSILSTWLNGGTNTLSGTSMSAVHVTGVGALYKGTYGDAASSTVHAWIVNNATIGVIKGNPPTTPNRLLNKRAL
jgi:subtilisin family serine protease